MKHTRTLITASLLLTSLTLLGFGCRGGSSSAQQAIAKKITLQWWRAQGSQDDFSAVIADYQATHPNVSVRVRNIRPEEFEQVTLHALAAGNGPDILSLPNNGLGYWRDSLAPLPPQLNLSFIEVSGFIQKQATAVTKAVPTTTLAQLRDTFVDVVVKDAVVDGKIYALPLALDSLVMFYNRDLLAAANVAEPPATWTDFKNAVQRITKVDNQGRLVRAGASLGTADNVPYAADILVALMMQNGTPMVDSTGTAATFSREVVTPTQRYVPGADAVRFYTDFANPAKETFSWSAEEPSAWEAFSSGKLAFTFGYWRDYAKAAARAPQVNIGVAPFPQIDGADRPTYYASYYLETVTKQSQHQNEAWDLLQFITKPPEVNKYLTATKQLTAVRSLVQGQLDDITLGAPAQQLLSSRSWYHGYNADAVHNAFLTLIRQASSGGDLSAALTLAAGQVGRTLTPAR